MSRSSATDPPSGPGWDGEFDSLYSENRQRVVAVAGALCEDPESAVDDAFMRLYQVWPTVKDDRAAWVTAVARNKAMKQHERTRRRGEAERKWTSRRTAAACPADGEAMALLAFRSAMQWLPPRRRAIFLRHHILNLSPDSIAAEFGISVASVGQELSRAKADIQRWLRAPPDTPGTDQPPRPGRNQP